MTEHNIIAALILGASVIAHAFITTTRIPDGGYVDRNVNQQQHVLNNINSADVQTTNRKQCLKASEVAAELGLGLDQLYALIKAGQIVGKSGALPYRTVSGWCIPPDYERLPNIGKESAE